MHQCQSNYFCIKCNYAQSSLMSEAVAAASAGIFPFRRFWVVMFVWCFLFYVCCMYIPCLCTNNQTCKKKIECNKTWSMLYLDEKDLLGHKKKINNDIRRVCARALTHTQPTTIILNVQATYEKSMWLTGSSMCRVPQNFSTNNKYCHYSIVYGIVLMCVRV